MGDLRLKTKCLAKSDRTHANEVTLTCGAGCQVVILGILYPESGIKNLDPILTAFAFVPDVMLGCRSD